MAVAAPPEREQPSALDAGPVSVDGPREHAIASLRRKRKFAQDSVAYVTVNGLLWLIWLIADRSTDGSIPWPAWVSLVWGFFLDLDGWRAYGMAGESEHADHGGGDRPRSRTDEEPLVLAASAARRGVVLADPGQLRRLQPAIRIGGGRRLLPCS